MANQLFFVRRLPQTEKKAAKAELKPSAIAVVGLITLAFVIMAIVLYSMKETEAGRLVIDIAIGFLGWSTGQAIGQKQGVENH